MQSFFNFAKISRNFFIRNFEIFKFFCEISEKFFAEEKNFSSKNVKEFEKFLKKFRIHNFDSETERFFDCKTNPDPRKFLISIFENPNSSRISSEFSPIAGFRPKSGSAGVRSNFGAGFGSNFCEFLEIFRKIFLSAFCLFSATSSISKTGVTQPSVPSKIAVHSSRVFVLNFSVNDFRTISGFEKESDASKFKSNSKENSK